MRNGAFRPARIRRPGSIQNPPLLMTPPENPPDVVRHERTGSGMQQGCASNSPIRPMSATGCHTGSLRPATRPESACQPPGSTAWRYRPAQSTHTYNELYQIVRAHSIRFSDVALARDALPCRPGQARHAKKGAASNAHSPFSASLSLGPQRNPLFAALDQGRVRTMSSTNRRPAWPASMPMVMLVTLVGLTPTVGRSISQATQAVLAISAGSPG